MLELYLNIKKRRQELGMSQQELAELTGYSDKAVISRIEHGAIDLPQSKIVAFAEALKTTPSVLMGWRRETVDVTGLNEEMVKRVMQYVMRLREVQRMEDTDGEI